MDMNWYQSLADSGVTGRLLPRETYRALLVDDRIELLPLLSAAFEVRKYFHGKTVTIHIINNVRNGLCSEDCSYCAQSKNSKAPIARYTTKTDNEILREAKRAYDAGAYRYCLVYAGRGMNREKIEHLAGLIRTIKNQYPLEVCVSAGILDEKGAAILAAAGLDRLNHNLNTSAARYSRICTTHSFSDRLGTLKAARKAGLEVCSGIIAGMGETADELIELAMILRELDARSIPINFLLPIVGNVLAEPENLTPQYCLRILSLFRFINPHAEIRVAAGREKHLRSMEVMGLYPANSIFMDGYLNTKGGDRTRTLQMISDAGFTIRSDKSLEALLAREQTGQPGPQAAEEDYALKTLKDLRPTVT